MQTVLTSLVLISLFCLCKGGKKFVKSDVPITEKPHIVFILADDLGWNEVSWHNSHFVTPRMASLSSSGVRLAKSYVTPKCSPSRSSLLSGLYPWRLGLQRGAIERFQTTGLNVSVPLLPELLSQGGYTTAMVGKWHLGYCHQDFLPNSRGFDSFFGQYNHHVDYYSRYVSVSQCLSVSVSQCLSVSVSQCLSVSVSQCLSVSVSQCLSVSVSHSTPLVSHSGRS